MTKTDTTHPDPLTYQGDILWKHYPTIDEILKPGGQFIRTWTEDDPAREISAHGYTTFNPPPITNHLNLTSPMKQSPSSDPTFDRSLKTTLLKALELVGDTGKRGKVYGPWPAQARRIATLINTLTEGRPITPRQVDLIMILIKVDREWQSPHPLNDNRIDICGYAALGGEVEG